MELFDLSDVEERVLLVGVQERDGDDTEESLHKKMEGEATKRVKYRYLIEEVAKKENIDFTKEEVDAKAKEMAENYGITVDELIKAYGTIDVVKYDMTMHKALEIIKENN